MAARARGSTIQAVPAACEGSTITGRCDCRLSSGMAEMSRLLRIIVSKVRMPRSQRMTFSLPPARMYSALMSHSSIVAERPRLSSTGFFVRPRALSRRKFCMLRAPTCRMSTSSNSGICSSPMISVTIGSPVSRRASRRRSSPLSSRPWKE